MRWWMPVSVAATVACGTGWAAPVRPLVPVAARGLAKCVIVTQPGATAAERWAASELASALGKVTGAALEVREVAANPPEDAIVVGPGPVASAVFPDIDLASFGAEELVMKSHGHRLLLAGGRPRGTVYAVSRFLQGEIGVRWWTPWAARYPKRPALSIRTLSVREKPAFELREPFWFPAFDGDWAARNRANSTAARLTEQHGGKITYQGFVHTYYPLLPPAEHFDAHPEWYSLLGGKRQRDGAQLCTSNPQVRDAVVEQVRGWLRANPSVNIVSVSQNDSGGACECANCKAIDDREGSRAGSVLELANYVGAHIAAEFPGVAIDTLAYQYTRKATRTLKPLPNVIVRLCSIECNFAQPLDHPSNAKFAEDIRDWSRLTNRLYVWDYTTNFAHYVLPHPNWYSLGPNVRFFHRNGVRGLFEQGAYQSFGSEMSELRGWVLAQLLWNPYQDDRKLIAEFLDGYYGPAAARPIRAYLDLMAHAASAFNMGCFTAPGKAPYLDFATLSRAERLWQAAEVAAAGNPDLVWRVRQGRVAVWYAWLLRWPALRRECATAGAEWPVPASRVELAERWLAAATGPGPQGWGPMTLINEGGTTPNAFVDRIRREPQEGRSPDGRRVANPPPPPGLAAADRRGGVDVQGDAATLFREPELAEFRNDPAASDLSAVWMPGSHRDWAFQIAGDSLPKNCRAGQWKVYVVARIDRAAAAAAAAPAFDAGVYDAGASAASAAIRVSVDQAGTGYRTHLIGSIAMNEGKYVWVAPCASDAVTAVWVDRVYLVPAR